MDIKLAQRHLFGDGISVDETLSSQSSHSPRLGDMQNLLAVLGVLHMMHVVSASLLNQQRASSTVPTIEIHLAENPRKEAKQMESQVWPPGPPTWSSDIWVGPRRAERLAVAKRASNQASRRPQASHAKFTAAEPRIRSVLSPWAVALCGGGPG